MEQTAANNKLIRIPGRYIDAHIAKLDAFSPEDLNKVGILAKDVRPIDLNSDEHRGMMAILSAYCEKGYAEEICREGITFTAYELCKRMGYLPDNRGRFGGKAKKAALKALLNLSKKIFTIYFLRFKRREHDENIYDAILKNCPLVDIQYTASDVTENDLVTGKVEEKVTRIKVRINQLFHKENYYKLFESDFYTKLKSLLEKEGRRISKYDWNFALWLIKQKGNRSVVEINVDKLAVILRIPSDINHKTRARNKVRGIYRDFKLLGYISDYKIDIPAKHGRTKDILYLAGQLG